MFLFICLPVHCQSFIFIYFLLIPAQITYDDVFIIACYYLLLVLFLILNVVHYHSEIVMYINIITFVVVNSDIIPVAL